MLAASLRHGMTMETWGGFSGGLIDGSSSRSRPAHSGLAGAKAGPPWHVVQKRRCPWGREALHPPQNRSFAGRAQAPPAPLRPGRDVLAGFDRRSPSRRAVSRIRCEPRHVLDRARIRRERRRAREPGEEENPEGARASRGYGEIDFEAAGSGYLPAASNRS